MCLESRIMAKLLEYGVSEDIPNKIYHSDDFFTSSTAVKLLVYDIPKYENDYLLKNRMDSHNPAFDMGSYIHSLILEPHKIEEEYAFFPGFDKRESGFQEFKENNKGKIILSGGQVLQAQKMMKSYNKLKIAKDLVDKSKKELTLCVDIAGIPVKVRFDAVNIEEGEIYDVKTSGYEVDYDSFKMNGINGLKYDISAALYSMAAELYFGKPFKFYFLCLSKKSYDTELFLTSEETMAKGRNKCTVGLSKLKYFRENNKWPDNFLKSTEKSNYIIREV